MPSTPISAAILAGGRSSRMGTDKALLSLLPGGKPLVSVVLEALRRVSSDVFIVGPNRPGYERLGVRVLPDLIPGGGALTGIHAALSCSANERCLVVGCDMPFLNVSLLEFMARESGNCDVVIPYLPGVTRKGSTDMVYHPLHAIYARSCLPAIEAMLANDERTVVELLDRVNVCRMDAEIISRLDDRGLSCFNVNTPGDLAQARTILAGAEEL